MPGYPIHASLHNVPLSFHIATGSRSWYVSLDVNHVVLAQDGVFGRRSCDKEGARREILSRSRIEFWCVTGSWFRGARVWVRSMCDTVGTRVEFGMGLVAEAMVFGESCIIVPGLFGSKKCAFVE